MELFALTRRLIDIESITPNEGGVGDFLCEERKRGGLNPGKCRWKGRGRMFWLLGRSTIVPRSFSPPTWTQCHRLFHRPKMGGAFSVAAPAMQRGLSRRRL